VPKVSVSKLHENNKRNQVKISDLKKQLSSYQKRIPPLNQQIEEIGKNVIDIKKPIQCMAYPCTTTQT